MKYISAKILKIIFIVLIIVILSVIFFPKRVEPINDKVRILFLGDMMFDRGVRTQANAKGFEYVFGPSTTTIARHDLTIANLEGPVSTFNSTTVTPNGKAIPGFQFTFATATASALKNAGIDMVSLSNNHTLNFGQAGMDQTRMWLKNSGVMYFGSPANSSEISTSTCVQKSSKTADGASADADENICIGLIGWHEFAYKNDQKVLDEIVRLSPTVDYLVVFPHWGVEYEAKPTKAQIILAHKWIDAGADAVIGTHPHVVQAIEKYNGKPIFYSLGNFIFDQYFSFDTTHGIGVSIELEKNKTVASSSSISSISAKYSVIPFSSVGTKVSTSDASSTEIMYGKIKKASASVSSVGTTANPTTNTTDITSWLTFESVI